VTGCDDSLDGRGPTIAPVIEMRGLTKEYGSTRAVVDLDLQIESAEVFGFLGPNGAGKTTTIRMLLALQRPTRGAATVFGLDCRRDGVEIHRRVGYLPGELALYPRMTGRQHLAWFARARGEHLPQYADELVERFDVVLDRPVRELSKGNRQKVGLVIACMHRPELLVLDEPTSGLDPLMQHEFERLVRETTAEGRTVFLSSHELDEVQRLADRVGIIREGRLVAHDTVEALRRSAPRRILVEFRGAAQADSFPAIDGVTVVACEGTRLTLQVTGSIGPVLRAIAEREPVDLVSRPADLDELFLELYSGNAPEAAGT
jgi:beta-exotoxin I transport system ATP-binding protein